MTYLSMILAEARANPQPDDDDDELREIKTRDQSGRIITSFEGSPRSWMKDFSQPPKRLVRIKTRHLVRHPGKGW